MVTEGSVEDPIDSTFQGKCGRGGSDKLGNENDGNSTFIGDVDGDEDAPPDDNFSDRLAHWSMLVLFGDSFKVLSILLAGAWFRKPVKADSVSIVTINRVST